MQQQVQVEIQIENEDCLPVYATDGAAGADVKAHISEDLVVEPGHSVLVPTGIRLNLPEGYEIQVRPRSGLAAKNQVTVLNSPGTVDSDYRGELKVILINHGKSPFIITPKMRIAQIILAPVVKAQYVVAKECFAATGRGEGGFGHTGTH